MKKLFTVQPQTHGRGSVIFSWHPHGNFLATCGSNRMVNIFNRQGDPHAEIALEGTGKCLQLCWDHDGEMLAVLQQGSPIVKLWDSNQGKESSLDTNLKDLTYIKWNVIGHVLAVGTAKGSLLIYNKHREKKQTIAGKHVKKITCGAWNSENKLALASEDRQVTISNVDGDTLHQTTLKQEPSDVQFYSKGEPDSDEPNDTMMSVVLGKRSLMIFDINDPDSPTELAFQPSYGHLVSYRWFGDGYIVLGFEGGHVVVMSKHEATKELFSKKVSGGKLSAITVSPLLRRAATCSGNAISVMDFANDFENPPEEVTSLDYESGTLESLEWTQDGQILTASSDSGYVYNFLACLPVLAASYGTNYVYLTSLLELSVFDASRPPKQTPLVIQISMEPTFAALGPTHVALGMNNHVYFHSLAEPGCPVISEREYLGTVQQVRLNRAFAAVLSEGKVHLHALEGGGAADESVSRMFPEKGSEYDIVCYALCKEFLVYGTSVGSIVYFHLADMVTISEFMHERRVAKIFPNEVGTRLVFVDEGGQGFLYNPVDEQRVLIQKLSPGTLGVLWDLADRGVFITHDGKTFNVFVYTPHSIYGPSINLIATAKVPGGATPVLCYNGMVTCQSTNGSIVEVPLPSHNAIRQVTQRSPPEKLKASFAQQLVLLRLIPAWELAVTLNEKELFTQLGQTAVKHLDVQLAIRVYRQLGDAGMVMALLKLEAIEDVSLLAGHVAIIFDDYTTAQELFLASARPIAALEMRRDLLHWEQALKLAQTLAADQVPYISFEFAQQLEFRGEYEKALAMYQKGLGDAAGSFGSSSAQENSCRLGIARMMLRLGDVIRGVQLALESHDKQCCRDCGAILEGLKQWPDAARLFEEGDQPDKAAAIYIKTKNWGAAQPLMARITSPKLHAEYAAAKEAEGRFDEAAVAYERASDMDSVVRLMLQHLQKPQRAFSIVRESKSSHGAQLVAEHCVSISDYRSAIEFFVLAKRTAEAFELATTHDQMGSYTAALGNGGTPAEYKQVAQYYDGKGDFQKAGDFWFICKEYTKALRLFLQCGERAVDQAIEVVGRARSDMLTHTLIDFLMGESDGVPKDPNYIFRLYMALGNYPQAAKTAVIIARQEQELGNYRVAHNILLDTYKELSSQKIRVPQELAHNLMLLHSYVLVKPLVKIGDHLSGARMLIRVARNISRFPMHAVPILTSTVIECHRAGLRGMAFEYASTLMRPEYRTHIQEAYKRKIEAIVRKPGDKTDVEEAETPSPFDPNARVAETCLECPSTKNTIPYCIATGRHIVLSDMCLCPSCNFPACFSNFTQFIESEGSCSMCLQEIPLATINKMDEEDAKAWLQKQLLKPGDNK